MATENAVMAAVARARRDVDRERRLRAARAGPVPLPRLDRRRDRRHRVERPPDRRRRALRGGEWTIGPEHIEVGSFIGLAAVTGGDLTIDDARRTTWSRSCRRSSGSGSSRARATTRCGAARPGARDPERPRRPGSEDRGRPVAGVPGGPHVDRGRGRDAGVGDDPGPREDVREPAVLRRQARLDGRADHRLRPAPRRRERSVAPVRAAADEPGHPRRDGDADRRALRGGNP